jgi:hypothetical protein
MRSNRRHKQEFSTAAGALDLANFSGASALNATFAAVAEHEVVGRQLNGGDQSAGGFSGQIVCRNKSGSFARMCSEGESGIDRMDFAPANINEGVTRQFTLLVDGQAFVVPDVVLVAFWTGLRVGDVALEFDRLPVASVGDNQGITGSAGPGNRTLFSSTTVTPNYSSLVNHS